MIILLTVVHTRPRGSTEKGGKTTEVEDGNRVQLSRGYTLNSFLEKYHFIFFEQPIQTYVAKIQVQEDRQSKSALHPCAPATQFSLEASHCH